MTIKRKRSTDAARDAALAIIQKITDRAYRMYADCDVSVERGNILMDLIACHFDAQKLRLDELLAADDVNFAHDIDGINRHLNRDTFELMDGFRPRFSA